MSDKPTVMIVEDEVMLRTAYTMVLETKGFNVISAENGVEALVLLHASHPDIILLDMLMPIMGGKEFLEASDVLNKHPDIKVIVYSNLSSQDVINDLMSLGVHEHLLKSSLSPNELVQHINALLV